MTRAIVTVFALSLLCCPLQSLAQGGKRLKDAAGLAESPARIAATERRRGWLAKQLSARVTDKEQVAQIHATLARLSHQQIDQLAAMTLQQQNSRGARDLATAQAELERAKAVRDGLRRRLEVTGPGRPPGFFPVITWLPSGASLTASAVVSPDRRYVRINAMPFFSQVGPVHTFNFFTGETRRLPQFGAPPSAPVAEFWYDGLRTRSDRRPGR